jgi:hypothetical protein
MLYDDILLLGELLRGYWHHGRPTAPFQALETATGYAFHAVRVAFAHNRPDVNTHIYHVTYRPLHQYTTHTVVQCIYVCINGQYSVKPH